MLTFSESVEEQLEAMRVEIQQLRSELDGVKSALNGVNVELRRTQEAMQVPVRLASLEPVVVTPTTAQAGLGVLRDEQGGLTPAESLPLMQTQLQELARTKVETNSRFSMRLFGTIVSNTFLNSGEPNWLDLGGNVVKPGPAAGLPAGSFTSTLRQSRLGAILDGPQVGSFRSSALVAFDFFGGLPNFQPSPVLGVPRLLYAYMRFENERTAFQIGQDHMILAPKNPTSLTGMAFPTLFRAGNLYLRVPQIRAERTVAEGQMGQLRVVGGILAPIAGDTAGAKGYQFVPPNGAGERSRTPGFQSRLSWRATPEGPYEQPDWEFGVSTHYSRERYTTGISPSWTVAADFDATVGRFGIGGEFFAGRNIDAFGASLAQIAKSRGGFIEGRIAATDRWEFNGGYGTNRLYDRTRFPGALARNTGAFGNTIYRVTPEIAVSFEYLHLRTKPANGGVRQNNHFDLTFAYGF